MFLLWRTHYNLPHEKGSLEATQLFFSLWRAATSTHFCHFRGHFSGHFSTMGALDDEQWVQIVVHDNQPYSAGTDMRLNSVFYGVQSEQIACVWLHPHQPLAQFRCILLQFLLISPWILMQAHHGSLISECTFYFTLLCSLKNVPEAAIAALLPWYSV